MTNQGAVQHQLSPFIGKGKLTESALRNEKAWMQRMIHLGHEEALVNFIAYTSLPKGHPDRMSKNEAAKQFYPEKVVATVSLMAAKAMTDGNNGNGFLCQLLHGQANDEYQKDIHNVKTAQSERQHKSLEQKAEEMAKKIIDTEFRENNKIASRGPLSEDLVIQRYEYRKTRMEEVTKDVLAELQEKKQGQAVLVENED